MGQRYFITNTDLENMFDRRVRGPGLSGVWRSDWTVQSGPPVRVSEIDKNLSINGSVPYGRKLGQKIRTKIMSQSSPDQNFGLLIIS